MLSAIDARRIAIAAAGLAAPRPARPGARDVLGVVRRLGVLQLDPINVLVPAQYLPVYSRLGPYDRAHLDRLLARRALIEQWAHAASIVPVEDLAMVRQRNVDDRRSYTLAGFGRKRAAYARRVLGLVRTHGPVSSEDIPEPRGVPVAADWGWTFAKAALEYHVALGNVVVAGRRRGDRARLYDLTERVLPRWTAIEAAEARRMLVRRALRALGVGTVADIADYYRLPNRDTRERLAELDVSPTRVEGWKEPAYVDPAAVAAPVDARALVSPFDPLVWNRARIERLFGFEYRIEIYTPAAKRRWGYYVLPFLLGDRLVARVDLKREEGTLAVKATHVEPGAPRGTRAALRAELGELARWLELAW